MKQCDRPNTVIDFVDGHAKAMTCNALYNGGDPSELLGTGYSTFD